MGAKKHSTNGNALLEHFAAAVEDDYLREWVDQARYYYSLGEVNEELLPFVIQSVNQYKTVHPTPPSILSKRLIDVFVSVSLLLLLSPVMLAFAIAIKLTSKGPVFYKQIRIGRNFQAFEIHKFRTMDANAVRVVSFLNSKLNDGDSKGEIRVTKLGKVMRQWSIDELPQLFDVLLGHMSLVGPRPLTPCDTLTTPKESLDRFAVLPGLTGLWQATDPTIKLGRRKLALDAEYARNQSLILDAKILFLTIPAVIRRALSFSRKS